MSIESRLLNARNKARAQWSGTQPIEFRPMLAVKCDNVDFLEGYPFLATPKIDGIRCITQQKLIVEMFDKATIQGVSRTITPIPNRYIQKFLNQWGLLNLDGELLTYTNGKMDSYNDAQSKIMTASGEPDFKFHVFDIVAPTDYWERMSCLKDMKDAFVDSTMLLKVLPILVRNKDELLAYEQACLELGFEGIMLRNVDGPYKFGRSTKTEGWLIKIKRFEDAEAIVAGFEELMHNQNEQEVNELGLLERSDHKANKIPGNKLGALQVIGHNGIKFNIGSGFTDEQRIEIWMNKEKYLMQNVKYKYQPHGKKEAPRCPIFLGFRSPSDIGNPHQFKAVGEAEF